MIKAEGAWAPTLMLTLTLALTLTLQGFGRAFSRQCRGSKIGLWVPGDVGRDQDGHWSLGRRAVTSRKSCLLTPCLSLSW